MLCQDRLRTTFGDIILKQERHVYADNAIAAVGHDTALVCYDRMGVSQGPYNNMHLPCWDGTGNDSHPTGRRNYTECAATPWPNGWMLPFGCSLDHSTTFCMRATVTVDNATMIAAAAADDGDLGA